ncbi:Citrate synthase [Sesbania bispinosa]|nr:Citrate synthase [Sesbania bispinosa]
MSTDSESATVLARGRLAMLTAHLLPSAYTEPIDHLLPHRLSAQSLPANLNGTLTIVDERTGKKYQVEVSREGTVKATDLKKISNGKNDKGLKLYDPGYLNTAPDIIQSMPHDAHPMGVLVNAISALSVFHPDANPALRGLDIYNSKEVRDKQIARVIGKITTIAAAVYLRMAGRPPVLPSNHLSYTENFLYMLDSLYVLCGVDVYTAIAGAVGALYGPLHGGANEAVLKMLSEIGTVDHIPEFIEGVKARKRKLSGFGHRVYKNYDPRAKVLKRLTEEVFSIVGRDPLIEVAVALEKVALSDEYFIKRKLYPNVDFYSGLIYRAMGFPPEYFTVLFAIPRMAGYLAHWRESLDDPDTKIMRPQQVYVGEWLRHYTPIKERTVSIDADKLGQVTISNASKRRLAGSGI